MKDYHSAVGVGKNLSVSHKHAREVLRFINGMSVSKALIRLNRVLEHKEAVPFTRFNKKIGHRPGIGPGRYPEKAIKEIIKVINNAKNNAVNKGLQEEKLIINEGIVMMDISKRKRIRARKGKYTGSMRLTSIRVSLIEEDNK